MTIELGRTYRTRDGREVRIYAVDGDEEMPVHGAILTKDGWKVTSWTPDGLWAVGLRDASDLIEVKPRIKRKVWINVYPDASQDIMHCRREFADHHANRKRIACVEIDIDVEEGHGL